MDPAGYSHFGYAKGLGGFGATVELRRSGGWLLRRAIPNSPHHDAMGCYPLFCCHDWSALGADLQDLDSDLISVALVTDPCGAVDESDLRHSFDIVSHFKNQYITDLSLPMQQIVSKHHRRMTLRALREVEVRICQPGDALLDDWCALYGQIVERHNLSGIKAFSRAAFRTHFDLPGTVLFCARLRGKLIGMHWYFKRGEVVYAHLAGLSPHSYRVGASYALHWTAIEYFRENSRWLLLGAGAGLDPHEGSGLDRYKRGWSTDVRPAYFCGRIIARKRYQELARASQDTTYFPAYRHGEFASPQRESR